MAKTKKKAVARKRGTKPVRFTRADLRRVLQASGACSQARRWVANTQGTPEQLWQQCPDGLWMEWMICMLDPPLSLRERLKASRFCAWHVASRPETRMANMIRERIKYSEIAPLLERHARFL